MKMNERNEVAVAEAPDDDFLNFSSVLGTDPDFGAESEGPQAQPQPEQPQVPAVREPASAPAVREPATAPVATQPQGEPPQTAQPTTDRAVTLLERIRQ